ncbi:MAG TPA: T9SS type A sorting domain-containing protein [Segetibacter sp.]
MKRVLLLLLVSFTFCFANGQTLLLNRPSGGDVWPAFSVQKIQWQSANVDNIKIEVSADSGRTWLVVQSSYPASATFYDWTVINKPSDSCFFRISDVVNPSVQSSNYPDKPFRIPKPTLNIDPVEGSVFGKTALAISWSSTGTQNVNLFITYDNFATHQVIANNLPAVRGFYNWIVKDTVASNGFIIIQAVNDHSLSDTARQPFSIKKLPLPTGAKYKGGSYDGHSSASTKVKSLKLSAPNTRVELTPNTVYPIRWTSSSINQVSIKYSIDSGLTWLNISQGVPAALSFFNWSVPNAPSAKCLVKITDTADVAIFDISDTTFAISATTLDLITPAENDIVYRGQVLPVSWSSPGVTKVNISYFDGSVWKTIKDGVTASNETVNWTIPANIGDSIKLRITDFDNPFKFDSVSKVFVKTSPVASVAKYKGGSYDGHSSATNKVAAIRLLKPNGSIQLASALQYTITWVSSSVANVDLAFSADSGYTWQNIVTSYSNSQSYVWNVPGVASSKCLVRIRSSQDSTVSDISDSVFTILPKSINLVINTTANYYFETAIPLEWTQQGIEKVSFSYKTISTGSWQKIKDSVNSTSEVYNWIIPTLATDSLWIKIFDSRDSLIKDEKFFSGVLKRLPAATKRKFNGGRFDGHSYRSNNNKINIYKPAANEKLVSEESYSISWKSGNVTDTITLQYSIDSGNTWINIVDVTASTEQYNWKVPTVNNQAGTNILFEKCLIRALETESGNEIVGISSRTFSISQSAASPVHSVVLTGKPDGEKASLSWLSENEMNVNQYEVERSFDKISYEKIGEVKSANIRDYNFVDISKTITGKTIYYRLKIVYNDGSFKYSGVATVQLPLHTKIFVYPNPARTYIQIQISHITNGLVDVMVTDISGKVVSQIRTTANGSNLRMYTGHLNSGVYIVRIKYKDEEHVQKLIITD